jgi:membrane associated rhomboid family serine protease
MSTQQLQVIFQELDYLDDGYQDGIVSHVGLRRIVLETPELEQEIGSTFTRALLARSEQNLYGRLTLEEFVIMAREVAAYQEERDRAAAAGYRMSQVGAVPQQEHNKRVAPRHPRAQHKSAPRNQVHNAAVRLAIPVSERDERISYLDQYSCKPPPLFLLSISLAEIGVFIWHVVSLSNLGKTVGPNGPPYIGYLIFDPNKKYEVWRFFTYGFVHSGYFHIIFNVLVQLILGIPLEMVHRWWRILLVYTCGVVAGSLATSITDPDVYLAGASGGVYALITAHLANVISNWGEMEVPALRLVAFLLLIGVDTGVAVYYRYVALIDTRVSYAAHIAGAVVGLLLGIVVLRNLRVQTWERVIWWFSLLLFLGLFLAAIVWNAVIIGLE